MTSSFLSRGPLNSIPCQLFLEVPEYFLSHRFPIFRPSRFPSRGALCPAVRILKPGRGCFLLRVIESSSARWASSLDDDDEEEDGLCPVDCVKEFRTEEEFSRILEKAKGTNSLVVVDFYRTSCGSCKYIEQGFIKLCKGSGLVRAVEVCGRIKDLTRVWLDLRMELPLSPSASPGTATLTFVVGFDRDCHLPWRRLRVLKLLNSVSGSIGVLLPCR